MLRNRSLILALLFALTLGAVLPLSAALANEVDDSVGFRKGVTLAGIREHQAALQAIASANGGTRASGTPGYDASAQYVVDRMVAAGYTVTRQPFTFRFPSTAEMARLSPDPKTYRPAVDVAPATLSPPGTATGDIQAVDINTAPQGRADGTSNSSGCEAADFAGFPAGGIALLQRGTCAFGLKALNAQAAGAAGVIMFNEGNTASRSVTLSNFTLGRTDIMIPVVGTSFAIGLELYNGGVSPTVRITVNDAGMRTTENIIAESKRGSADHVVVIGAHLDSVLAGPGINDNGSGSATTLEVAEVYRAQDREPQNKLRFIWFGAEELGLLGARHYVSQLPQAERDKIKLNLNFDMIGSPNFVRFVYDGDNSAYPVGPGSAKGPQGSGEIERVFHDYFASQGLNSAETPFSGRSDYGPFIEAGIPAGGLFTGAEGIKTAQQAAIFGGTAGVAYDPCYHQACDTFDNNSASGLDQMSDAVAHTVLYFAKRNFDKQPLINPAGPVSGATGTTGGGGLHDDHDHELIDR